MSSDGASAGAGAGAGDGGVSAPQQYFCYQCNRTVSITPDSPSSELVCPDCNGGFLEEYENPNSNSNPIPNPNPIGDPHPFFAFSSDNLSPFPSFPSAFGNSPFVFSSSFAGDEPTDLAGIFGGGGGSGSGGGGGGGDAGGPNRFQSADEFNPLAFLQNYLNTLQESGANIQFVVDNNPMEGGAFRLPPNLGDYFIGPGLEQLIQQLAENDPNRYGTPPAAKSAVEALPTVKISKDLLDCEFSECAICKESFNLDEEAKQMPCKHIYHSYCIMPWLEMHNSCPVCRYELPTDDPDYENRVGDGTQSSGGGLAAAVAGGSQENADTPRVMGRRFRIQLPWQFRAVGEASNSRGGNSDSGGNAGGSDSGNQAREEDLD